ncbi:MAG: hypothetical protein ACN4GZ_15810 [Acidimicrobiales bacterium]
MIAFLVLFASAKPVAAGYNDWWNWAFYDGYGYYRIDTHNIAGNPALREFKNPGPQVSRAKYGAPLVHVCDRQAAIQFYLQPSNYWYSYDYSAFRSGCKVTGDAFNFPVWIGLRVSHPTYTHAWWVDADTNGFKLLENGWMS